MSFFFGGGGRGTQAKPQYTGLQLQTASSTLALAIAWGANRFAPNLIWYKNFQAHAHKEKQKTGKGGLAGGSQTQTTYTYSVSCILALCEGEINGIGKVFKNQDTTTTYTALGMSLFTGTVPQAAWGYVASDYGDEARDYPGVAYLGAANYDLGSAAVLPNHSFEVFSRQYSTALDGSPDADPSIIFDEFLTMSSFGVGMPATTIDYDSLYSGPNAMTTGDATLQTYCAAQGFGLSPVLSDPHAANDTLDSWAKMLNVAIVWTGYILKFIPYDLSDIDGNGYKYRPRTTAFYTLTDDDFISDAEDPVIGTRTDPSDAFNALKLTISDRENDYNDAPVEWKDQGLIDQYGLRPAQTFAAPEITRLDMATKVVAMMGQRAAYVRNTYAFTLGSEYCLLEPMDPVELYDKRMGLVLVQITNIEESEDDGSLNFTADQLSIETTSSSGFTPGVNTGGGPSTGTPPGPVNVPVIFDPPADLSGGVAQVWAAVSGGNGTVANKFWGGAVVYVSRDNTTYTAVGTVTTAARQGKLTANLAGYTGANPDSTNTASVSLLMSDGHLISATADEAADDATLSYLGGEIFGYETATLTGISTYDLTDLYRHLYRTTGSAHTTDTPFARLDNNIFKYTLPKDYIGIPLKFKFQSYNIWGQAAEELSDCVAYDYTPTGLGFYIAPPGSVGLTFTSRTQADGTNIIRGTVTLTESAGPYLDHYDAQISSDGGTTWFDVPTIAAGSTDTAFEPALAGVGYKARVRAVSSAVGGVPSNWVTTGTVNSGNLATVAPNAPTGLATSGGQFSNKLTWVAAVGGGAPSRYNIYAIHASTGSFGSAVVVGTSTIPQFTHTGLGSADTWRYFVTAWNFVAESAPDGPVNSTTSTSASAVAVKDEGSTIVAAANSLNFKGVAVTVTDAGGGQADIDFAGSGVGGIYAPLVNGDLPGPGLITNDFGECIMVEIVT